MLGGVGSGRGDAMRNIASSFVGAACFAVLLAACSNTNPPTTTPSAPTVTVTVPTSAGTISGIVAEGSRPLAGVQVDNGYGPNSWAFTDASGRFSLCSLPADAVGIGAAVGNSYGYLTVP